jgi:hypothetical protein
VLLELAAPSRHLSLILEKSCSGELDAPDAVALLVMLAFMLVTVNEFAVCHFGLLILNHFGIPSHQSSGAGGGYEASCGLCLSVRPHNAFFGVPSVSDFAITILLHVLAEWMRVVDMILAARRSCRGVRIPRAGWTFHWETVHDAIQSFNFFGGLVLEPLGVVKRLATKEGADRTVPAVMNEVVAIVHE